MRDDLDGVNRDFHFGSRMFCQCTPSRLPLIRRVASFPPRAVFAPARRSCRPPSPTARPTSTTTAGSAPTTSPQSSTAASKALRVNIATSYSAGSRNRGFLTLRSTRDGSGKRSPGRFSDNPTSRPQSSGALVGTTCAVSARDAKVRCVYSTSEPVLNRLGPAQCLGPTTPKGRPPGQVSLAGDRPVSS